MQKLNVNNVLLYSSYLLTSIEDRAWSFAVALTMQELGGMRLVSIEQFAEGISCMIFSGSLGKYCDDVTRRRGISTVIPLNNFSLMAACASFVTCLWLNEEVDRVLYTVLLVLGMLLCAANRLGINQEKNCLGRDWVIVLGVGHNLSKLNAILTTLDQLANVISPLVIGGLVSLIGIRTTALIFGAYSCGSILLKAVLLNILLAREPRLSQKVQKVIPEAARSRTKKSNPIIDGFRVLGVFWRQRIFAAALGMALLFMTVLGFDGLAIGYGQSVGLPDSLIGGFRSFGSLCGILGAVFYAFFEQMMGVRKTGVFGLAFQQVFLIVAVSSIFMPGTPMDLGGYFNSINADRWWSDFKDSFAPVTTIAPENSTDTGIDWKHFKSNGHSLVSIFAFLIGIATARFGLWMADLAITQVMQEGVEESERNTTFSVLKDVMVIVLPEPSTFAICMIISYLFVLTGFIAYIYYLLKTRNDPHPIKASTCPNDDETVEEEEDENFETEKL